MNPYDAAHALAKALRESKDLKELKEAQSTLKTDQAARNMLIDFRTEQLNLQKQKLSGIEVSPEQEQKLEKLFEVINMNKTIKEFLQAEYRAAVLMQDIYKIIGEATGEMIDEDLMGLPKEDDENDIDGGKQEPGDLEV
jgi:cell fate (sporulation/competence/biofilm development) regulator YlbF (YheA/YmcA/DUF963 family)